MPKSNSCLPRSFFNRKTLKVASDLLGKQLVKIDTEGTISGIVNDVEAYVGTTDLACHAHSGRTKRNLIMWGKPGFTYIYLIYGIHWLLNFETEEDGVPAAVLLRGIVPIEGQQMMLMRRKGKLCNLTNGPARICQALNLSGKDSGKDLCNSKSSLFLKPGIQIPAEHIKCTPRIGINSVPEPWKSIPWRYTCQIPEM